MAMEQVVVDHLSKFALCVCWRPISAVNLGQGQYAQTQQRILGQMSDRIDKD